MASSGGSTTAVGDIEEDASQLLFPKGSYQNVFMLTRLNITIHLRYLSNYIPHYKLGGLSPEFWNIRPNTTGIFTALITMVTRFYNSSKAPREVGD